VTAKLIEAIVVAFPMWKVLLVATKIVIISVLYLHYYERISIDKALSLQFLWFLIPIPILIGTPKGLEIMAHIGSGIILGMFLSFCLYAMIMTIKKLRV
jgi:uncharacterized membrane protein (Fun14 family)